MSPAYFWSKFFISFQAQLHSKSWCLQYQREPVGWSPIRQNKKSSQKDIYRKARELPHIIDPEYAANDHWVVRVHCLDNTSIIGRHFDAKDIIFQHGVTVGEFEGGNLLTWNSSGVVIEMNVRNQIVKLDGRLHHAVTPIISGIRYSLYYFKSYDPLINEPTPIFEPAVIIKT